MFDSHAHVLDPQFDADRDDVLPRAQAAGVAGWIEVGTSVAESEQAVAFVQPRAAIWASAGVHPNNVAALTEADWRRLEQLSRAPRVVAIGEVGFDFYRGGTAAAQRTALERFISLARDRRLPMIFHVRDGESSAHDALLHLLQSLSPAGRPRGVIHTYSGTWAQAQTYLELGLYLSFSGVVTFKNAGELTEVAKQAPLNRLLIETDCPYLAPMPHRGERNEPAYVRFVAKHIAELRGVPLASLAEQTQSNTERLFKLLPS